MRKGAMGTSYRRSAKLKDAVYGLAVGDALGVPYEFEARGSFECTGMAGYGTHRQPKGTWSDDTSMALALCDSIRERGGVDVDDIRTRFREWLFDGRYTIDGVFDYGGTTFRALESGVGESDVESNGNGSLMRTVPLAFTDASDEDIERVSAITHAHPISTDACVRYVHMARLLAEGASARDAAKAVGLDDALELGREDVRSTGYVVDTLMASAWCLCTTSSFEECVLRAVNLGDDTDTTCAVAGALAGIVYGFSAIPSDWLGALRSKEIINSCLF